MSADLWVLVPAEPTPEMEDAGERTLLVMKSPGATWAEQCGIIYRAMLAAAPAAPAAEPVPGMQRPYGDLRHAKWLDPECYEAGACQSLRFKCAPGATPAQSREPLTDECAELPPAYMLAKLQMVMPLFQEARDALTAITEAQRKLHGIRAELADRMDEAGTFSLDEWKAAHGIGSQP